MTANPSYTTGTVTVANGASTVTGIGTIWSGVSAKPGDMIYIGTQPGVEIKDITDTTHLTLWAPWAPATQTSVAYTIVQEFPARVVGAQIASDVSALVGALNASGYIFVVLPGATAPDPSLGNDGQYAVQPNTGLWWLKAAGVWVASGAPVAGYGGTSATSLAVGTGSKVFTTQINLAYNGARVRAASIAAPATNWMEGVVTYSGSTLTMTVDKIAGSGTHTDWVFAVAGQPGNAGDVVSTNNGSDFATPSSVPANIGAVSYAVAETLTLAQKLQARKNLGLDATLVSAYLSTSQTVSNNVATKVHFNTKTVDTLGFYDNVTNFRFQPITPISCWWDISASVQGLGGTSISELDVYIYVNGATYAQTLGLATGVANSTAIRHVVQLNGSTDYVEIFAALSGTGALSFINNISQIRTWFEARLIG